MGLRTAIKLKNTCLDIIKICISMDNNTKDKLTWEEFNLKVDKIFNLIYNLIKDTNVPKKRK